MEIGAESAVLRRAEELRRSGHSREAARLLVNFLRSSAPSSGALQLLADIQASLGDKKGEAAALGELLTIRPLDAAAWGRLGLVQGTIGRWDDAWRAYRQATHLKPGNCSHWEGLALSALATQRFDATAEPLNHILSRCSDRASSQLAAGHIYKASGDLAKAMIAYRRALAIAPDSSEAIYNCFELSLPDPDDPLVRRAERLAAEGSTADVERVNLGFALGRVYEAAQRYEAAFERYDTANAAAARVMLNRGIAYSPEATEDWVTKTVARYPSDSFSEPLEPLPFELRMIFVVGMPRSGTTLVEQVLSAHPMVRCGSELTFTIDCEAAYLRHREKLGLRGPIDLKDDREREALIRAREIYLDKLFERGLDSDYVCDKLPGNFARLGLIRLMFPDAFVIHCKRHPIATCWSLFTANFAVHDPYYNSLDHLAHYYRCYQRLMGHWLAVLKPRPIELAYEDLVQSPERHIGRLLEELALPWDDRCLAFHEQRRPIATASYRQVRMPIYTTSLERWKPFESKLAPIASLA
jgi:tetratricopeptide (TPR) repeat protein